jgi:hypothetical protein
MTPTLYNKFPIGQPVGALRLEKFPVRSLCKHRGYREGFGDTHLSRISRINSSVAPPSFSKSLVSPRMD